MTKPGVLEVRKYWQVAATGPPPGENGNWGSELGGDARPSRDQEPTFTQVPLVLVLFACSDNRLPTTLWSKGKAEAVNPPRSS